MTHGTLQSIAPFFYSVDAGANDQSGQQNFHIFSLHEFNFIQNLIYYISRTYRTQITVYFAERRHRLQQFLVKPK